MNESGYKGLFIAIVKNGIKHKDTRLPIEHLCTMFGVDHGLEIKITQLYKEQVRNYGAEMIKVGDYQISEQDKESVMKVLNSGRISEGKYVAEFERMWAEYIGTKYCVLTNSGTSALLLSLYTLKMQGANQYVVTSPLTFVATINAIVLAGFKPVFVDVDRETFVMNAEEANKYVDIDTVMPVHLYGYPVEMDRLTNFKYVIEDACEAHGTVYVPKWKKVGSIGDMGCFSFYIAHNIQVGDMGAITTNDKETYTFLRKAKAHGRMCECKVCKRHFGECPHRGKPFDPRFTFTDIAYNFKTNEFQAALGINQVMQAEWIVKRRQNNVAYLNDGLSKLKDKLQLPPLMANVSYLAYPVIAKSGVSRNRLCIELEKRGIETRPIFSCVPTQQPAYEFMKREWAGKLPNAEWIGANGLHVGIHQYLEEEDLDKIITAFKEILG